MTAHLVLVEDNPSDVELLRTAFEEIGVMATYSIFRDGDLAIAGLAKLAQAGDIPHVMLVDLNLPKKSGHDIVIFARTLPEFAAVPIVIFSTSNHPDDRTRCLNAGAKEYRVKPPRFADLLILAQDLRQRWLPVMP